MAAATPDESSAARAQGATTPAVPAEDVSAPDGSSPARSPAWLPWLAWGWILLLVLTALAELGGLDDLRLALDFQRHLR